MALTWEHMKELKKNRFILYLFALAIGLPFNLLAQDNKQIGVLFYNAENLFDNKNDSLKLDDEFTPNGDRHWSYSKYWQKLKNISRVIYEAGAWNPPAIIGLCEIENRAVLTDLVWKTGLNNLDYNIIHHESPDLRGIDVALLYRKNIFTPLESIPITVNFGENTRPTRDILYVYGLLHDTIPLHVFVAHFPSRYGGVQNTKPLRYKTAQILNDTIQNILLHDPKTNIIAMGDFNDEPEDESMQFLAKAKQIINISNTAQTINNSLGTLKYQYEWNTFDQFFISKNLMDSTQTLSIPTPMQILDFSFLLEEDKRNTGLKPFRTYVGFKYNNGFSDHFPIWLTLKIKNR